jgi:hypothetical protein
MWNPIDKKLITKIVKKTTPKMLGKYFNDKGFLDKDFELLSQESKKKEVYYQDVNELLDSLQESIKQEIISDFRKVNFFIKGNNDNNDNVAYLLKIVTEGKDFDYSDLNMLTDNSDKVFLILLRFPSIFEDCYYIKSLKPNTKYWTHRNDYFDDSIALEISDLEHHLKNLKQAVQKIFQQELRGNQCQERIIEFKSKIYLFFQLDDYLKSISAFDQGMIEEKKFHPVFETTIIIDKAAKVVNIYSDSSTKRNEIHQIVGSALFKKEQVPLYYENKDIFDPQLVLENLRRNKRFAIDLPDTSPIKDIYINKLTLLNTFEDYSEIILDSKQNQGKKKYTDNQMIYRLLSDQKDFQNPEKYKAKSVEFVAVINDSFSAKLLKKPITINKQGLTNLSFEEIDEQIKEYFRSSGIMKIV